MMDELERHAPSWLTRSSAAPTPPALAEARQVTLEHVDLFRCSWQVPLSASVHAPDGPGVYLIFYGGPIKAYRRIADRTYPVYVGKTDSLRSRLGDHRRNCKPVENLDGGAHLTAIWAPTGTSPKACYVEGLLIAALRPLWNQPSYAGFGSKHQGHSRAHQRRPAWSVMHPGRPVGTGKPTTSRRALHTFATTHLTRFAHPGLWIANPV